MGCNFFERQRFDRAGVQAVKLQKFIIFVFVLSLVAFGLTVHCMMHHGFFVLPFLIANLVWITLYLGFLGAYRRNSALIKFFQIVCAASIFVVLGLFLFALAEVTLPAMRGCHDAASCALRQAAYKAFPSRLITIALVSFVPFVLGCVGFYLSCCARHWVIIARAAADIKQSLMKAGIPVRADFDRWAGIAVACKDDEPLDLEEQIPAQLPHEQAQYAPVPIIHAQAEPHTFEFQPMSAYPQPVYILQPIN